MVVDPFGFSALQTVLPSVLVLIGMVVGMILVFRAPASRRGLAVAGALLGLAYILVRIVWEVFGWRLAYDGDLPGFVGVAFPYLLALLLGAALVLLCLAAARQDGPRGAGRHAGPGYQPPPSQGPPPQGPPPPPGPGQYPQGQPGGPVYQPPPPPPQQPPGQPPQQPPGPAPQ